MFDFVAKRKRILQVILGLTIIPFAFFGLESYTNTIRGSGNVALVDGIPVSQREFADELQRQQERVRELFGRGADLSEFDTPEMRLAILESMIAQRLVMAQVADAQLALSREQVVAAIVAAPEFQEGGKFSSERYMAFLRSRGMSDEGNVERLRLEIPAARLAGALSASAFQPRAVAERLLALQGQQREIAQALIQVEPFLAQVKPAEAQVKVFYDANSTDYRIPERVRAEYLVLSAAELAAGESASDAELKAAYEARAAQYGSAEQRRASHILVKTRQEADRILAEARAAPQRFTELAKEHSLDSGSAANGGDLGLNPKGALASKPLEDAIFRLKDGETEVVQTEFGFHVVRVTGIQPGKARSFDEVRTELAAELAKEKAAKRFAEAAEGFNNMVYEQSDSLKPAAERYKLKLMSSDWLTRQATPESGALAHPKLRAALFAPEAIQQRRNTDAVEVAPGVLVAARVAEHRPAAQRPFEEVKAEVAQRLARREAAALAQKEGTAKLAALAKGGDAGLQWGAAQLVSRREARGLEPQAMRRIMAADVSKLPAYVGVERGDQGYAIYRIARVIAAEPRPAPQNAEELARLDREAGAEQFEAYVASLRARAKVEISRDNLEKK
ncbi:MAG: SurA N-terminal domain-containing protein [Betaproteobacteria bacterium]|nr:SurA N-terminal domain-containing protein [Betaproteobacteria bacterium]